MYSPKHRNRIERLFNTTPHSGKQLAPNFAEVFLGGGVLTTFHNILHVSLTFWTYYHFFNWLLDTFGKVILGTMHYISDLYFRWVWQMSSFVINAIVNILCTVVQIP